MIMYNQQGPTVQHSIICSVVCGSLDERGVWQRMETCICTPESFCCPPETVTILLTGHTPRQNKKLNKFFQKRKLKASPHITFSERFCLLYAILSSQFAYISHIYQKSIKQNVLNHLIATCSFNSRLSFPKQQQKPFRTLKITSLSSA